LKILGWEGRYLIPAGCTLAQYTFYHMYPRHDIVRLI
jgi:hypothetical protein